MIEAMCGHKVIVGRKATVAYRVGFWCQQLIVQQAMVKTVSMRASLRMQHQLRLRLSLNRLPRHKTLSLVGTNNTKSRTNCDVGIPVHWIAA